MLIQLPRDALQVDLSWGMRPWRKTEGRRLHKVDLEYLYTGYAYMRCTFLYSKVQLNYL